MTPSRVGVGGAGAGRARGLWAERIERAGGIGTEKIVVKN